MVFPVFSHKFFYIIDSESFYSTQVLIDPFYLFFDLSDLFFILFDVEPGNFLYGQKQKFFDIVVSDLSVKFRFIMNERVFHSVQDHRVILELFDLLIYPFLHKYLCKCSCHALFFKLAEFNFKLSPKVLYKIIGSLQNYIRDGRDNRDLVPYYQEGNGNALFAFRESVERRNSLF